MYSVTHIEELTAQAKDQAVQLAGRAKNVVTDQIDQRSKALGTAVGTHAGNLRAVAQTLREQNQEGSAHLADMAADRLSGVGTYLETTDGDRLIADAEQLARRQPIVTVGVGVVLGLIAARMLKASSADRYDRYQNTDGTGQRG